ncbi:hypothetical protein EMN47_16405 [Prolixibacteraceae bacterium JC049]|nr:hypothetical protein [Prolixibacteraceae bacterium JC049]
MKKFIWGISIVIFPVLCSAQDNDQRQINIKGFLDSYHALQLKNPNEVMSSRTRLRTELGLSKENIYLYTSLNATYNSILNDEIQIELREAYMEYTAKNWSIKAGRQIVIWGNSDGLRITDVVSPMDMTEFLARDYDDIRIPVNGLKLNYTNTKLKVELIFIPVSSFFIVPVHAKNPWSVFALSNEDIYSVNLDDTPQKLLKNGEFGGRLSFYLSGIDFSFSVLHTWNKMPVFKRNRISKENDTTYIKGIYKRMDMLGFDFSYPLSQFILRGEAALYLNEALSEKIDSDSNYIVTSNTSNILLGVDWYPGAEWTITAQYSNKYIADYNSKIEQPKNTTLATLGITKKVFRSTLALSSFTYFDITNKGAFNRTSIDYALTDEIHALLGCDWFNGDKGMFGKYKDNTELWIKLKYSF